MLPCSLLPHVLHNGPACCSCSQAALSRPELGPGALQACSLVAFTALVHCLEYITDVYSRRQHRCYQHLVHRAALAYSMHSVWHVAVPGKHAACCTIDGGRGQEGKHVQGSSVSPPFSSDMVTPARMCPAHMTERFTHHRQHAACCWHVVCSGPGFGRQLQQVVPKEALVIPCPRSQLNTVQPA
jgi:hypothetical protein